MEGQYKRKKWTGQTMNFTSAQLIKKYCHPPKIETDLCQRKNGLVAMKASVLNWFYPCNSWAKNYSIVFLVWYRRFPYFMDELAMSINHHSGEVLEGFQLRLELALKRWPSRHQHEHGCKETSSKLQHAWVLLQTRVAKSRLTLSEQIVGWRSGDWLPTGTS